uniref:Alpha-ketoglutarate-dependent dioxygenase AlkB-like domain-containing protein n=1 Tax=Noctiluca scintillans TaxID=2966 RepID=A0A7S1AYP6_NOCSC|mmetsp:Transcript_65720/g.174169  ORF Transcript_65720/g.174169 Transcript_65720/m.174169 type:complete len:288 (+) Transcript_65720:43-906(+)
MLGGRSGPRRYAITFGEVSILHTGSAQIGGGMRERGFSVNRLRTLAATFAEVGCNAELVMISDALPEELRTDNEAAALVLRNGVEKILGNAGAPDALWQEQESEVRYDTKYWDSRRSRTLNKRARHNVVFGDESVEPSADFRRFTVKAFSALPHLSALRTALSDRLGPEAQGLNAEGNLYFEDASGIGFHGDGERKIVVCVSLGSPSVLRFHWRLPNSSEHTFEPVDITVHHGDIYIMSEKATGFDWRSRSRVRVVHAAGSSKYIGRGLKRSLDTGTGAESATAGDR